MLLKLILKTHQCFSFLFYGTHQRTHRFACIVQGTTCGPQIPLRKSTPLHFCRNCTNRMHNINFHLIIWFLSVIESQKSYHLILTDQNGVCVEITECYTKNQLVSRTFLETRSFYSSAAALFCPHSKCWHSCEGFETSWLRTPISLVQQNTKIYLMRVRLMFQCWEMSLYNRIIFLNWGITA